MTKNLDMKQKLIQRIQTRRRSGFGLTLNLTPMMDVMFNLLIFFLVATSFNLPEGLLEAKLPRTTGISTAQTLSIPVIPVKIFLEPGDRGQETLIRVSSSLRSDAASLTVVRNFEELNSLLRDMAGRPGMTTSTPIIIAAKPTTTWDQVVNAYNASLRAKYKNVVFASWK